MAQHFLQHYGSFLDRPAMTISAAALQTLQRHPWPGNIRELENTIHNAVLLTPGNVIESADLELLARTAPAVSQDAALEPALAAVFARALARKEENLFERVTAGIVQAALSAVEGNQVRAAAALGISRNSLRTQLANLGNIQPRRRVQSERRSIPAASGREIRIGYQKFGTLNILKARRCAKARSISAPLARCRRYLPRPVARPSSMSRTNRRCRRVLRLSFRKTARFIRSTICAGSG
jgi:hypothetical protein